MPSRESSSGLAVVTSSPRKRTRPAVARSSPERRLRKVDLPAPLGPMTACTRPSSKASETSFTAESAPNRRVSCSVWSSGSATGAALQEAGEAAGEEEDHRDHQDRDQRVPMLGDPLAVVLDEGEEQGAEGGPVQGPFSPE